MDFIKKGTIFFAVPRQSYNWRLYVFMYLQIISVHQEKNLIRGKISKMKKSRVQSLSDKRKKCQKFFEGDESFLLTFKNPSLKNSHYKKSTI